MSWAVRDFLKAVADSLGSQGYRVDSLADPRPLGEHGGVWRCTLSSPEQGMPLSVIIKQIGPSWPWRFQDWACQYFLSDLPGTQGLGPEFFAADLEAGYYLLEDLGLGTDLGLAVAQTDSRGTLAVGLLACALAGLHAGTFGRERIFGMLRAQLPPGEEAPDEQTVWERSARQALGGLDPGLAEGLEGVLGILRAEMESPGEFLCLTHGDWYARSAWYGDSGPRLLDFRAGAYRHALLDLAAWEWRCGVHDAAAGRLVQEYLGELSRLGADRGGRFEEALARARAWMGLWHLGRGERGPLVRRLLERAAGRPELGGLAEVVPLL